MHKPTNHDTTHMAFTFLKITKKVGLVHEIKFFYNFLKYAVFEEQNSNAIQ